MTRNQNNRLKAFLYPTVVVVCLLLLWYLISRAGVFHSSAFPSPAAVATALAEEIRKGRLFNDLIVSLFRVTCGFGLAIGLGIPFGMWIGLKLGPQLAFLPIINFLRNLSPLAWMPFAILWFGVGDSPAIFLIFLAAIFPVILSTMAAVANIPAVFFKVADDYGLTGFQRISEVILPAIMPQVITMLRVTAGLSWLVVVAAEMIAGRDGLGFAVMDSRNGLRTDILVVEMFVIGIIGIVIDRLLVQLTKIPSVRWGYER